MSALIQHKTTTPQESILLFGKDLRLVETRRWVLEKAGFRLFSALRLADVNQIATSETIDLFVFCDSLDPTVRNEALTLIHGIWPSAKLLVLTSPASPDEIASFIHVFPAMDGPRKLLSTINHIMTSDREYTL